MSPIDLLGALLLITLGAVVAYRLIRHREHSEYRRMAVAHRMHYSPHDPLRLTPRVAADLPVPGAAAVRVIDLLYRTDDQLHYYIFTVEYSVGVVGRKSRVRRAAAFAESKTSSAPHHAVRFAPADLSLLEQYRSLIAAESSR